MSEVTNEETIKAWGNVPLKQAEQFGDEGDTTRQYLLNPALFALLRDVSGNIFWMPGVVRVISADCSRNGARP